MEGPLRPRLASSLYVGMVGVLLGAAALTAGAASGHAAKGGGTLADPVGDANGGADITAFDFTSGDDGFLTFRISLTAPLAPNQGVELDVDTIGGGGGSL